MTCSIENCEGRPHGWGWCEMHYRRWRRSGKPEGTGKTGRPRGEPTYTSVHQWLRTERGHAHNYPCLDCGGTAGEWSYLGGAPDERRDGKNRVFSPQLDFYSPRCIPCHRRADARPRGPRGKWFKKTKPKTSQGA